MAPKFGSKSYMLCNETRSPQLLPMAVPAGAVALGVELGVESGATDTVGDGFGVPGAGEDAVGPAACGSAQPLIVTRTAMVSAPAKRKKRGDGGIGLHFGTVLTFPAVFVHPAAWRTHRRRGRARGGGSTVAAG